MSIEMGEKELARLFEAMNSSWWLRPTGKSSDAVIRRIDAMHEGQDAAYLQYAFNMGGVLAAVEEAQETEGNLPGNYTHGELEKLLAGYSISGNIASHSIGEIADAIYARMMRLECQAFRYGYYAALEREVAQ